MTDAPNVETAKKPAKMNGSAKTVMVVEDNDLNMKLFHDLLEAHGYNILQTKDGMEALKLAREHRPDLILMDIQLPEVSGLEVTKWIKEDDSLKSIPVVAVTALGWGYWGDRSNRKRLLLLGTLIVLTQGSAVAPFIYTLF